MSVAQDVLATAAGESSDHVALRVTEHYERRGRELWGLARRLGATDEQAADVVQESHLRLRELTLDPAIASRADPNPGGQIQGTPHWLAGDTLWRMYGAGGPDGLDGPLPFAIAPSVGDEIPTGTWLTVHGHFDDAASATCERTFPEEWGAPPESRETQRLLCRELFVVTSFETRNAP